MSPLFKTKPAEPTNHTNQVVALIQQRRLQVLVHSCIYYTLCSSIVSDEQWQRWANELVQLQKEYPQQAEKAVYAKEFRGFDATTGFHLPIQEPKVVARAKMLLNYHREEIEE